MQKPENFVQIYIDMGHFIFSVILFSSSKVVTNALKWEVIKGEMWGYTLTISYGQMGQLFVPLN